MRARRSMRESGVSTVMNTEMKRRKAHTSKSIGLGGVKGAST